MSQSNPTNHLWIYTVCQIIKGGTKQVFCCDYQHALLLCLCLRQRFSSVPQLVTVSFVLSKINTITCMRWSKSCPKLQRKTYLISHFSINFQLKQVLPLPENTRFFGTPGSFIWLKWNTQRGRVNKVNIIIDTVHTAGINIYSVFTMWSLQWQFCKNYSVKWRIQFTTYNIATMSTALWSTEAGLLDLVGMKWAMYFVDVVA